MSAVSATATARAQIAISVKAWLQSNVVGDNGAHEFLIDLAAALTNGTAVGACDKVWFGDRTLAGSASEDHDLAGSLTDALGAALTFAKVKLIVVKNTSTTDGVDLSVGPVTAANGFGIGTFWNAAADKSICPANGMIFVYDPNGAAVTAGTADLLTCIARAASTTTYKILIIGTSA